MAIRWAKAAAILALAVAQPAAARSETRDAARLARMTPAAFQARTTLHDDDLDTAATITTADAFVDRAPLLGLPPDDVFLRAFIDKRSGRTSYQVYVTMRYRGYGWADWRSANYATPAGVQKIARLRVSCSRRVPCARSETIGFAMSAALLDASAALYDADRAAVWRFKMLAQDGRERAMSLPVAEMSGLRMAVDAYRTERHLPPR